MNLTQLCDNGRRLLLGAVITCLGLAVTSICEMMQTKPGHLMQFGSSGKNIPVDRIAGFPHTTDFLDDFAKWRKPVLMEGAIKHSRSFVQWTDEYLRSVTDKEPTYVMIESMKKEVRGKPMTFISLQKFMDVYNYSNIYSLDSIPHTLAADVLLPCPLQCPSLLDSLYDKIMWFSSGGTKSVVHVDEFENILCSVRGRKHLTMVDKAYGLDNFHIEPDGSMQLDVDRVDLNKYPILSEVNFLIADLTPGDCLYIPENWVHQVNSYDSNIGLNFWWYREATEQALASGACRDAAACKQDLYLSDISEYRWRESSGGMLCYNFPRFLYRQELTW